MIKRTFLVAALPFGLALSALPAQATILFHGGEQPDFTCVGTCTGASTTAGLYRSNYARLAIRNTGAGAADPVANRWVTPAFTGSATVWLHFEWVTGSASSTSNVQAFRFIDNVGNPAIVIRGTGTANQFKIDSRTSGGVFSTLVTCTLSTEVLTNLAAYDIKITLAASGEATVYQNGVQQCTFSGDTRNGDGATTITQIDGFNSIVNGGIANFSEVIVADASTIGKARFTLVPGASGNATSWSNSTGTTPCTTTIMGQTTLDDTKYVNTGSNSQKEQCTVPTGWPTGVWSIDSFSMSIRALVGASGPQHITPQVRTGSTDYSLTPDWAPTTSFAYGYYIKQDTNPATSAAWSQSDFTTAGFNVGFMSAP